MTYIVNSLMQQGIIIPALYSEAIHAFIGASAAIAVYVAIHFNETINGMSFKELLHQPVVKWLVIAGAIGGIFPDIFQVQKYVYQQYDLVRFAHSYIPLVIALGGFAVSTPLGFKNNKVFVPMAFCVGMMTHIVADYLQGWF